MVYLVDEKQVTDRSYQFLSDWNKRDNMETMKKLFGYSSLHQLNIEQYLELFKIATKQELILLKKNIN